MAALMRTFTGRLVNIFDLRPEDIDVKDIAHHLALINRFNGGTKKPINVAQHSVYVSRLVFHWLTALGHDDKLVRRMALEALFHDAEEAYLGDMTKWMKQTDAMRPFRVASYDAHLVIYKALGLTPFAWDAGTGEDMMPDIIGRADRVMVRFEGSSPEGYGKKFMESLRTAAGADNGRYALLTEEERAAVGNWKPWSWKESEEGFHVQHRLMMGIA